MVLVIHDLFANARKGASKHKNTTSERYRESRVEKLLQRYSVTKLQGFTNPDETEKFALEQVYRIAEKNARTHRSSVNNSVCIKYVSSRYRKPTGLVNSMPFFCNLTVTVTHPKSAITLRSAGKSFCKQNVHKELFHSDLLVKRHSSDDGIEQIRRPSLRYFIPAGRENHHTSVTLHLTLENRKNGGRKRYTGREFYPHLAAARLAHDISNFFRRSAAHMMREAVTVHKLHYRETEQDGEYTMTSLPMGTQRGSRSQMPLAGMGLRRFISFYF
ncbi:hypothetical protein G5I_04460 [Acromyrmex echinatior]|uniref:Uncharacterized protein n=1 Tax=Acromyrmex echinatior TaxID=103372 RepID=F4WFQ1_ACREC|nr:hypothetical protein G5I_04460 [Acromyrmex echinatior]